MVIRGVRTSQSTGNILEKVIPLSGGCPKIRGTYLRVVHHDHELFDNFAMIAYLLLYRVRNNQKICLALRCREVLTWATAHAYIYM